MRLGWTPTLFPTPCKRGPRGRERGEWRDCRTEFVVQDFYARFRRGETRVVVSERATWDLCEEDVVAKSLASLPLSSRSTTGRSTGTELVLRSEQLSR